jgi:hypothetical protein
MKRFILTLAFCAALISPAFAQGGMGPGPGTVHSTGGGGSPTWTGTGAAANGTCGFLTTCNVTASASVTTGVVVVMVGLNNQQATGGTVTGISVCGTALTVDVAPTIAAGTYGGAMGHGSVTGGTCTISVTFSVASSIENAGAAWGTLNNLASSTPGTPCNAFSAGGNPSPYPCTGGLTVGAGGFGIVGYFDNQSTTPTSPGTIVIDANAKNVGGSLTNISIGHVTASCTAAQCEYAAAGFAISSVIGEPFL